MNEALKDKIQRKIEGLPDETARQLLDYIEFLESKYNRSQRKASPFERVAETVESTLGAGKVRDAASKGAGELADAAVKIMSGIAAAARAAADEFQKAAKAAEPPAPEDSESPASAPPPAPGENPEQG